MEVILVYPQGFCRGVIQAISITKKTLLNKETKKPVYILGNIVHNKHISLAFKNLGLITITKDDIKNLNHGTIIFSAHGVSPDTYDLAKSQGLEIVDATCPKVKEVHDIVKEKINEGYLVAFLGKKDHIETKGILGISENVVLVNDDLTIPNFKEKTILVSQTTLSLNETEKMYNILKEKYPTLELSNQICNATFNRQKAAIKASMNVDLAVVVGDKMSNNCNTLRKSIEDSCNVKSILIDSVNELINFDFTNISKVCLTSGASTPKVLVKEVYNFLKTKELPKEKDLNEYLKL